mgnify:CR=1 FL=1
MDQRHTAVRTVARNLQTQQATQEKIDGHRRFNASGCLSAISHANARHDYNFRKVYSSSNNPPLKEFELNSKLSRLDSVLLFFYLVKRSFSIDCAGFGEEPVSLRCKI